jgi:hypothetical protein
MFLSGLRQSTRAGQARVASLGQNPELAAGFPHA